jgi:hypothetical protein
MPQSGAFVDAMTQGSKWDIDVPKQPARAPSHVAERMQLWVAWQTPTRRLTRKGLSGALANAG